jgi:hypothetical protein
VNLALCEELKKIRNKNVKIENNEIACKLNGDDLKHQTSGRINP